LENLKDIEGDERYTFIKGDVCDFDALKKAAAGVDAIVHFAAESHVDRSIQSGDAFLETNIMGTQRVIDVVRELNTSPPAKEGIEGRLRSKPATPSVSPPWQGEKAVMILVSTDEVYGDIASPKKSKDGDAFNPSSPYSASKAASEVLALAAIRTYGIPAMITRCTNNYGPYQFPEKIIPLFISNAIEGKKLPLYDGGTQIRDWLYITDHCSAIDVVLRKGEIGQAYDIAAENDPEVTNRMITETILTILDKPKDLIEEVSGLRPGHDQRYAVDSSKIRKLGWRPSVTLEQGISQTIKWYQDNEAWWTRVKDGSYQAYYKKQYTS